MNLNKVISTLRSVRSVALYRNFCSRSENSVHTENKELHPDMPIELEESPFKTEKEKCVLCRLNIEPDYKNVRLLSQFQSRFTGRIYGRHITGLCKRKQESVEREILKAQNAGLMGYFTKEPKYVHDPKLFDPDHPFRPHKY